MCAHLLLWELQNYNSLLNNHQQENTGSHQKKIPHVQGQRRSPSKMVGGAKLHLELNPIPARDVWRTLTNFVCTRTQRPHRDWARPVFESPLRRYGSAVDRRRGRGSGWSRPGCGISPHGGGAINSTTEPPELTQDWGNRLWEGTNKSFCAPGPSRKEQWPHKRLTQTCPWVFRSLWQRHRSVVACCGAGGTECSSARMGPFHYLHHSVASGQTT